MHTNVDIYIYIYIRSILQFLCGVILSKSKRPSVLRSQRTSPGSQGQDDSVPCNCNVSLSVRC